MRLTIQNWLGREYVALSCEGTAGADATAQTRWLFDEFDTALQGHGLGLENTVRTRIIARDRQSRVDASNVRQEALTGQRRAAGSSYIWPSRFASDSMVSIDLLAARPSKAGLAKTLVEYDPPVNPLRYHVYDGVVYLSGVTSVEATLAEQIPEIVSVIGESLTMAGVSWDRVVRQSFFLHRSQKVEDLRRIYAEHVSAGFQDREISFVDDYSAPEKLIEIETTALLG